MTSEKNQSSPTIVGGQPLGKREGVSALSRGIERIVLLAAKDGAFRKEFTHDRTAALQKAAIVLTEPERLILENISTGDILSMARCLSPRTERRKRRFLRAAATLAALTGLHACTNDSAEATRGTRPEPPTQGIRPEPVREYSAPEATPTRTPQSRTDAFENTQAVQFGLNLGGENAAEDE